MYIGSHAVSDFSFPIKTITVIGSYQKEVKNLRSLNNLILIAEN